MRTYGTAVLHSGDWHVKLEPHVALRFKRVFPRVDSSTIGVLRLRATNEVSSDLRWFDQRFPLEMTANDRGVLERKAATYNEHLDSFHKLVAGEVPPGDFKLAIPPREYQRLAATLWLRKGSLLCADDVGLGKAQPLDAKVLTPTGWRLIGSLNVGDVVMDPDGGTGKVTGVFPRGRRIVYRVTTKDGAAAECCEEHLWGVYSANDRTRGGAMRVLALRDFKNDLKRPHASAPGWATSKWFLPLMEPAQFEHHVVLPLDPWLLGVLLGDGCFRGLTPRLSKGGDPQVLDRVRALLPASVTLKPAGGVDWRISRTTMRTRRNPVAVALRTLGLLGKSSTDKLIPARYFYASPEDRIELLRGLMDTDGDCAKDGTTIFNTSSPLLRDGVVELVRGLGGIASVSTKVRTFYTNAQGERVECSPAYRVNVRTPFCPFSLERKAARWKKPYMARAVGSVDVSRECETVCIAVSTKRNLYVTDGHLVTHNTATAICGLSDPATHPALVVTLTHLPKQWEAEINRFCPQLTVHRIKQGTPYDVRIGAAKEERRRQLSLEPPAFPHVLIINYHKLAGWADALAGVVKSVVFDEIQELRTGGGYRYQAATRIAHECRFRLGTSATPIYNHGDEFWNVINCLDPDALGSRSEFLIEWCSGGGRVAEPRTFGVYLREQGIMLRRTRKDVGRELPPLSRSVQHCDTEAKPLADVATAARELARIILSHNSTWHERGEATREIDWRLRQATGLSKGPHVVAFVRLLVESGEKVVLYGWHRAVYDLWLEGLEDLNPVLYTGSESPTQKEASRKAFCEGDAKVLIMSLRAGAGLDGLQRVSRTVVFGELDWSPGVHEQCEGRVYRDMQEDPVTVFYLVADEGSDPIVSEVLGLKRGQIEGVRDPDAELIEQLDSRAQDAIKRLAAQYLQREERPRPEHAHPP